MSQAAQGVGAEALTIRIATSSAEYRAAGYLRATSFFHPPADRSEFAKRVRGCLAGLRAKLVWLHLTRPA